MPIISRQTYGDGPVEDSWLSEFSKHLEKNSVQSRSNYDYLYDQMSSIIRGNKPRYPSVEAAVQDMQERTGLTKYRNQLKANEKTNRKVANEEIEMFKQFPDIKQTIDNYIHDTHGNMAIPEIVDHIRTIHKNDVQDGAMWASPSLLTYIKEKNDLEKENHPDSHNYQNLGKVDYFSDHIDPSNTDALHILNPAPVMK